MMAFHLHRAPPVPEASISAPAVNYYSNKDPSPKVEDPSTEVLFPPGAAPGRRLISLDVLRAAAILLVLCGHVQFRAPDNAFLGGFWFFLRQTAVTGVDIFYVLSGFLVGGLLLSEHRATGSISLGHFFTRRAWRLWPSYFLAVLFGWQWYHHIHVMHDGVAVQGVSLRDMWPFFLHVQNYYDIEQHKFGAGAVMQTWTVASLVHFYILVALLLTGLAAMGRRAMGAIPWISAGLFVACFFLRWQAAPIKASDYDAWKNYFPTHLRLDEPMFGVLLAYLVVHRREALERVMTRGWWMVALLSLAAFGPAAFRKDEGPRFLCIWGYTLASVGAGGLILCAWWLEQRRVARMMAQPEVGRVGVLGLVARGFGWVGVWSYSIYLWHQPLIEHLAFRARQFVGNHVVKWDSPLHYTAVVLMFIVMSVALGAVMYYLVELPFLILREQLMRGGVPRLPIGAGFPIAAVKSGPAPRPLS